MLERGEGPTRRGRWSSLARIIVGNEGAQAGLGRWAWPRHRRWRRTRRVQSCYLQPRPANSRDDWRLRSNPFPFPGRVDKKRRAPEASRARDGRVTRRHETTPSRHLRVACSSGRQPASCTPHSPPNYRPRTVPTTVLPIHFGLRVVRRSSRSNACPAAECQRARLRTRAHRRRPTFRRRRPPRSHQGRPVPIRPRPAKSQGRIQCALG